MANTSPNSNPSTQNSSLAYLPVSMFAIVMGLTGLALAWHKAHEMIAAPILVSEVLRALASLLFVLLLIAYATKIFLFPAAVHDELTHPVRINFFATPSIGLLLLATAWLPDVP